MIKHYLPFLSCLLMISCGLGGDSGSSGSKKPPVELPETEKPQPNIEIGTTLSLLKPTQECPSASVLDELPTIDPSFHSDELNIPDKALSFYAQKALENHETEDFNRVSIAQSDEYLEIFIGKNSDRPMNNLNISFGGIKYGDGTVVDEYKKTIELRGSKIFVSEYGQRTELSQKYFEIQNSDTIILIRLLKPVVGFAHGLHAWWAMVEIDGKSTPFHMARMILPPIEKKHNPEFVFYNCSKKISENKQLHTIEVIDTRSIGGAKNLESKELQEVRANSHYIYKAIYVLGNDYGIKLHQHGSISAIFSALPVVEKSYLNGSASPMNFIDVSREEMRFSSYRARSQKFLKQIEQVGNRTINSFLPNASADLVDYVLYLMIPNLIKKFDGKLFYTEAAKQVGYTGEKGKMLAFLTAHKINPQTILNQLKDAIHQGYIDVPNTLGLLSEMIHEEVALKLMMSINGWYNDMEYSEIFSAESFDDDDSDGLINLIETNVFATSDEKFDSDSDGWSDLSEYIHQTEPSNEQHHPFQLVEDGGFGDWMRLLRKSVMVDPDLPASECSESEDITHFAVKANEDTVALGAKLSKPISANARDIRWSIPVIYKDSKIEFLVDIKSNSNEFSLIDIDSGKAFYSSSRGYDFGRYGVELVINKKEVLSLLSKRWPEKAEDIAKISGEPKVLAKFTVMKKLNENIVCDETSWVEEI